MIITKRNGTISVYDDEKVKNSILKANAGTSEEIPEKIASAIADEVFSRITDDNEIITTANVREGVNEVLCERGFPETARQYMEYK